MQTSANSNKSLWLIASIVLLNGIGFTMVFPLLPFLVGSYVEKSHLSIAMSVLASAFAICTFLAAPILGALSDRYGRKIILTVSLLGSAAGYGIMGIGGSLWILLLGRMIDGLTAGNISTLFAYISDTTEANQRTKWFSILGASMGLGTMIGPAIGGALGAISISLTFYVTAAVIFASVLAVIVFLPESLARDKRSAKITIQSFNTFANYSEVFAFPKVKRLFIIGAAFYSIMGMYQFNISLYLKDVFNGDPKFIGFMLTTVGISDILSRAFILPRLVRTFHEKRIGVWGIGILVLGFALIPVAGIWHLTTLVFVSVAIIAIGEGLFEPTYNSGLSQTVPGDAQGKLQGINESLQSAYHVAIPFVASAMYVVSPYLLYACITVIAVQLWLMLRST